MHLSYAAAKDTREGGGGSDSGGGLSASKNVPPLALPSAPTRRARPLVVVVVSMIA